MSKSLEEISKEISIRFQKIKEDAVEQKQKIILDIEKNAEELKKAAEKGDRSENAEYSAAVEKASLLSVALSDLDARLKMMDKVDDEDQYEPIGMVVMYSTVRFSHGSQEFIYKIYPEGVSDISNGILAKDAPIGRMLWLKEPGEEVSLEHRITGDILKYRIEEVY